MACNDPSYDLTKHTQDKCPPATPIGRISRGSTVGGTSRSTPIAFSVPGWTNGLLVSICACLAHIYVHGEAQGWTHFTLFISFLICCFKLCNHLHTINCDIWMMSTTTTSFLHLLISVLLFLKIFTLEQTILLLQASMEVDDPSPRGRVL